jgi:hypothetical protein
MVRVLLWVRYGFCTCLGLALIGLAAVFAADPDPEAASMRRTGSLPPLSPSI